MKKEKRPLAELIGYLKILQDCETILWRIFGQKNVRTKLLRQNNLLVIKFSITKNDEEIISPSFYIPGLKKEKFKNLISNFLTFLDIYSR